MKINILNNLRFQVLTFSFLVILSPFLAAILGMGDVHTPRTPTHDPVYMSWSDLRTAVEVRDPVEIRDKGKIYVKGNYLFINEKNKGIHVYNNSNPKNPTAQKFIYIPGNVDIAIKGNTLYADSFVDLVVLDVTYINNITVKNRLNDVFPYNPMQAATGSIYYEENQISESRGVVIEWKPKG